MEHNIIRIPVNDSLFTEKKKAQATDYLSKFFDNTYICSFVVDNENVLCLQIEKKQKE